MSAIGLTILAAIVSWVGTGGALRYAQARSLIDEPNERSSHAVPTPRGGGLAIVVTVLGLLPLLAALGYLRLHELWGYLGSGLLVAAIGFADDHSDIAAPWRLLAHIVAAVWLLEWIAPLLDWSLTLTCAVGLVWLTNLYNFMDGIDGIASIEAITVCVGGVVLFSTIGVEGTTWSMPVLLLGAVVGFLPWNFPRARVFMGDVGSGFLGLVLGGVAIQASFVASEFAIAWILLLGCFVVDATYTLIRRIISGQEFYRPHREHAYQVVGRRLNSHKPVSVGVGLINLFWLLPVAFLVATGTVGGIEGVVLAWSPIVVVVVYISAHSREGFRSGG